jgi:hypothetical protein
MNGIQEALGVLGVCCVDLGALKVRPYSWSWRFGFACTLVVAFFGQSGSSSILFRYTTDDVQVWKQKQQVSQETLST